MPSPRTLNDRQLTTLFIEGDEEAFVEIYRRNWQTMFNSAYKRLEDESQCEDLVQNIFVDLWERRQTVAIDNLSAYLLTAVKFQVIKYSTRRRSTAPLIDNFENYLISPLTSEDHLLDSEIAELVTLWIEALPEKRRMAFVMYYLEGMSTTQISEKLGITQKTVQNQIANASENIRNQVSKVFIFFIAWWFFS
jgi:RNA polymerase sigma factor (sigma-70 family)